MAAAAAIRGIGGSLGRSLKEIRIHLCQRSPSSQGVRCGSWPRPRPAVTPLGADSAQDGPSLSLRRGPAVLGAAPRDFIEQHYVTLKKANPDFPILIRECSEVQPKLWARYEFGRERCVPLNNLNVDQVAQALENIVKSKA